MDVSQRRPTPAARLGVLVVQLLVLGGCVLWWGTDSDSTDTTVDWYSAVVGGLVVPLAPGLAVVSERAVRLRTPTPESRGLRVAAAWVRRITLAAFVLAVVVAPVWVLGEVVLDPVG